MKKQLMLFNGRWSGRMGDHIYICAHSKADAGRLYVQAGKVERGIAVDKLDKLDCDRAVREINIYFSDCWGTRINQVVPVPERGVWIMKDYNSKPERII